VICGLAPALHICGRDLANPLREATRGLAGGTRQAILRKGFVVAEVALSLMLLVGAGLMIRTFIAMQNVDLGIRVDRLLTMRLPLSERRYPAPERRIAFFQELLRRVSAVPGVVAVGLNSGLHPMGSTAWPVEIDGSAQQNGQPVLVHHINPDYTRVFGIGLVGGRLFTGSEVSGKQHLALVNQTFARRRLDGQQPVLGRIVRIPRLSQPPFAIADAGFQIVGIVQDTMNRTMDTEVLPEVYVPFTVLGIADRLVVRTQANPASVTRAVTSQVYGVDKDQPVTEVQTVDTILQEEVYAGPRFNLALFSVFAALGLVLAVVGVYGVMSNSVAQQTHEIGVRMALGANGGAIAGMIVRRGAVLLLVGIALGLAASFATTRLLANQIRKVSPLDPIAFGAVSLILLAAGLQACVWPARRAARIDPITALRTE
jgi:predicted permease